MGLRWILAQPRRDNGGQPVPRWPSLPTYWVSSGWGVRLVEGETDGARVGRNVLGSLSQGKERPRVRRKPVRAYWRVWYSVFNREMRVPSIRGKYACLQLHLERERRGGRIQSPWAKSRGGGQSFPKVAPGPHAGGGGRGKSSSGRSRMAQIEAGGDTGKKNGADFHLHRGEFSFVMAQPSGVGRNNSNSGQCGSRSG
jgi:hypothetical protein